MVGSHIYPAMLAGLAVFFVVVSAVRVRWVRMLESKYPEKWVTLNKPGFLFDRSVDATKACFWFLYRREYVDMGDREFSAASNFYRWSVLAYLVYFAMVVAVFVATVRPVSQ